MIAAAAQPRRISVKGWIRLGVRLLCMALLLLTCVPLYYVWRLAGADRNPWPRLFLAGIGRFAGMRVRIEGERVKRGAFLLSNHVSWLDIPALAAATGSAFVAHDGLASVPLLRWLCEMNDTVFIARHDRTSVATQVEQLREAIRETGALTIFPEGTTSDGTGLLPFKSSLLSAIEPLPAGIAVQPVLLDYGPDAADIAWVGEEHGIDNFKRILARGRRVQIDVRFLPPLAGEALTNRKTIAAAAREQMLHALQGSR
jgi:1-acyl-sn-glycerol-3-phosphate acyltransferase